jgi:hypothetical protein
VPTQVFQLVLVVLVASTLCDGVHALLHKCIRSPWHVLRAVGALHGAHHAFLDEKLRVHPERLGRNLLWHHVPETVLRATVAGLVAWSLAVGDVVTAAVLALVVLDFVHVLVRGGLDAFHRARTPIHARATRVFVDSSYHALHHTEPDRCYAAHTPLFDWLVGAWQPVRDRLVLVVDNHPSDALVHALQQRGARVQCVTPADLEDGQLERAHVVVLAHGSDVRGEHSYEALLARAARVRSDVQQPLAVWALGDDVTWRARAPLLRHAGVVLTTRSAHWPAALTVALGVRGL